VPLLFSRGEIIDAGAGSDSMTAFTKLICTTCIPQCFWLTLDPLKVNKLWEQRD
jgi:hypothetical protein